MMEDSLAPWNFRWVVKGELAIMGHLKSSPNVDYVFKDMGIRHLVSLSPEKQPPFEFFPNYVQWTPIDILQYEPPSIEQILVFINICRRALQARDVSLGFGD
jgi:hypothetical protein